MNPNTKTGKRIWKGTRMSSLLLRSPTINRGATGLRLTRSRAGSEPFAALEGKLREGSDLLGTEILRYAQDDMKGAQDDMKGA